ncbi:scavenger receptor cysteine-rich type 1 protein M130-like [Morone saxatilis]|uniref:scavenger receptor cysteine-rich type 1 protein M130-like n=1 Tax=Morone saxatilis TaxID=34816 RepID=UPI0015E1E7BF|nr:scavenger receptor cysteine-rich type 1 protein M130-like [Morone saxatilis]
MPSHYQEWRKPITLRCAYEDLTNHHRELYQEWPEAPPIQRTTSSVPTATLRSLLIGKSQQAIDKSVKRLFSQQKFQPSIPAQSTAHCSSDTVQQEPTDSELVLAVQCVEADTALKTLEFGALEVNESFTVLVPCSVPHDARLAEGNSLCSGRLEIKHQGEWRALNTKEREAVVKLGYARVACRQMGCGSVVSIAHRPNSSGPKPAWEVNFTCRGTEQTLKECSNAITKRRVQRKDSSGYSLEVICSESVRLLGESDTCTGSVEVKLDQGWASVCEDGFDSEAQKVVCRELGCGPPGSFRGTFRKGEGTVLSKQLQCKGNESRLMDCASSIHSNCTPASGISCSYLHELRLVEGENHCEGTLVGKENGEWRPMSDPWVFRKPKHFVDVCQKVGCADAISYSQISLSQSQPVWSLSTRCGSYSSSSFCEAWSEESSTVAINMTCSESVRLANLQSIDRCSGKVEVKSGQSWVPVCDSFFSPQTAIVTCRELQCGFPLTYHGLHNSAHFQNAELAWNPVFMCEGKEKHLMDCPSTKINTTELRQCGNTHLTCTERPPQPYITVHVQEEEVVLDDFPQVPESHRFAISCSLSSPYNILSIRLTHLTKPPTEQIQSAVDGRAVFMFPAAEDAHKGIYQCDYNYDFSSEIFSKPKIFTLTIKENNYVRLVDRNSSCAGRLEVEHQKEWRPVSHRHSWGLKEAAVLCRQLKCGSAVSTRKEDKSTELLHITWRFYSDCNGSEHALMDCGAVKQWLSSSTVEVVCSGKNSRGVTSTCS